MWRYSWQNIGADDEKHMAQVYKEMIAYLSTILSLCTPYSLLCSVGLALHIQTHPL